MNDMIKRTDRMTQLNCECPSTNSVNRLARDIFVEEAPAEAGVLGAVEVAAAAIDSSSRLSAGRHFSSNNIVRN